jgi:hypothetical protein
MSPAVSLILIASVVGMSVGVAMLDSRGAGAESRAGSRTWRIALSVLLAGAAIVVYWSSGREDIETKGPVQESIAVVCCYLAMLTGMVAQYFYRQAETGAERLTFKPIEFLMPIFASPIVFIPLLTITADAALSGPFTTSKLMVYFVAFQNGFFWKNFFEDRRRTIHGEAIGQHT